MKKQIITIIAVAVLAIALFIGYTILKGSDIDTVSDPTYQLNSTEIKALGSIGKNMDIAIVGYNSKNSDWITTGLFLESIKAANEKITISSQSAEDFSGVIVKSGKETVKIPFNDMFLIRYDGARYAYDTSVVINAMLKLDGKQELKANPRALNGYDLDGDDVIASGRPYLFPQMERNEISMLVINNEHGQYTIFQEKGAFYFGTSRMIAYDEEMFAQVSTHCRHCLALGKMDMPEGNTWETYGLGGESEPSAIYSIVTAPDKNGEYINHTVIVGNISSSGSYYFARYTGGIYKTPEKEGDEPVMVKEFSKDCIYLLDANTVEGSFMIPQTDLMKPSVMNAISDTNAIYGIDNVHFDFYDLGISATALNVSDHNPGDNLSSGSFNANDAIKIIGDKKYAKKGYSAYEGGWQKNLDVFAGFTSSDKNQTYIDCAIMRVPTQGKYEVKFGLLKATADNAYLPNKVTVTYSTDGVNWHTLENGSVSPAQDDKTVKTYTIAFESDKNIKFIRVIFDIPQTAGNYVVFDEIRVYLDGLDAQPSEAAIGSTWRFISPESYIPAGRNFAHTDTNNFGQFIQSLAVLEGERVVDCGFSKEGDASPALLDKEKLAKYGLAEPARHYSFEYDDVTCDFYISAPTEDGIYYVYSTFSADVEGVHTIVSTDVIVELTVASAPWLAWDFDEFLEHALFSIYTVDCTDVKFAVTENGKKSEYDFKVVPDGNGSIKTILLGEKDFDVTSFRYLYQTILSVQMQDEYKPSQDELAEEWLRIEIKALTDDLELVFYRVSNAKCYFTVNGSGGYYCLSEDVRKVITNLNTYINGGKLTLYDC